MSPERGRRPRPGQAGLTIAEVVVGLGLMGIVAVILAGAYKVVSRGKTDIANITSMQQTAKTAGTRLESDLKRAGFGLGGATVFSTLRTREVAFSFKDLVGAACAAGEIAAIRYSMDQGEMVRELWCGGASSGRKATSTGRDSIQVTFRYLDDRGHATAQSGRVRTVEYTLDMISGIGDGHNRKTRSATGSVSIVNNGG